MGFHSHVRTLEYQEKVKFPIWRGKKIKKKKRETEVCLPPFQLVSDGIHCCQGKTESQDGLPLQSSFPPWYPPNLFWSSCPHQPVALLRLLLARNPSIMQHRGCLLVVRHAAGATFHRNAGLEPKGIILQ